MFYISILVSHNKLSSRIICEPYSATIAVGIQEFALIICGIIEPSITRTRETFFTRNLSSTTASGSLLDPHRHVPALKKNTKVS